jgi:hypothetical protein
VTTVVLFNILTSIQGIKTHTKHYKLAGKKTEKVEDKNS